LRKSFHSVKEKALQQPLGDGVNLTKIIVRRCCRQKASERRQLLSRLSVCRQQLPLQGGFRHLPSRPCRQPQPLIAFRLGHFRRRRSPRNQVGFADEG